MQTFSSFNPYYQRHWESVLLQQNKADIDTQSREYQTNIRQEQDETSICKITPLKTTNFNNEVG